MAAAWSLTTVTHGDDKPCAFLSVVSRITKPLNAISKNLRNRFWILLIHVINRYIKEVLCGVFLTGTFFKCLLQSLYSSGQFLQKENL